MKLERRYLNVILFLIFSLSLFLYILIGYYINRTETDSLILSYGVLFLAFIVIMFQKITPLIILILGLIFRLIFIISLPELSQDFYRFFWDGNLQLININPYLYSPNDLMIKKDLFFLAQDLFNGMGKLSNIHFSNYPPISQWSYLAASYFGENNLNDSVLFLRIIIIFFELCTFYILYKMLNILKLPLKKIGWYFLNPLVIIELTGNLHGEGIMMFFFLAGVLFLYKNKTIQSSIMMALSVGSKLITLMLIPMFFKKLGIKKSISYFFLIVIFFSILWIPYLGQNFFINYIQTIKLWFNRFEFNASFYYVIREFGFFFKGYNIIQEFGKITPFLLISVALFFTFLQKNDSLKKILTNQLLLLSIYFFIATTVHPWYIISLVMLCVFTPYFYPIAWSATIFLSYTAYTLNGFQENSTLILLEYLIVFGVFLFEVFGGGNKIFKAFVKNSIP
ncbi:MAG: alpha-1,6-mannosyltransferase [Candidatus Marivariicella framensis]|jgi:alpha-1,6-mannosyltransferase